MKRNLYIYILILFGFIGAVQPPPMFTEKFFCTKQNLEIISLIIYPSQKFLLKLETWDEEVGANKTLKSMQGTWEREEKTLKLITKNAVLTYKLTRRKAQAFGGRMPLSQRRYLWVSSSKSTFADKYDLVDERELENFLQNQLVPMDSAAKTKRDWRRAYITANH